VVIELLDPAVGRPKPIVELFLRIGPDEVSALDAAATADALHQAAHKLKGTASILGLKRLAAVCREVDDLARAGELEAGRALLESIGREFEATCEALRDEIK
jgi:HPt (histidine-containing phosphotransfer) domain-containing protein